MLNFAHEWNLKFIYYFYMLFLNLPQNVYYVYKYCNSVKFWYIRSIYFFKIQFNVTSFIRGNKVIIIVILLYRLRPNTFPPGTVGSAAVLLTIDFHSGYRWIRFVVGILAGSFHRQASLRWWLSYSNALRPILQETRNVPFEDFVLGLWSSHGFWFAFLSRMHQLLECCPRSVWSNCKTRLTWWLLSLSCWQLTSIICCCFRWYFVILVTLLLSFYVGESTALVSLHAYIYVASFFTLSSNQCTPFEFLSDYVFSQYLLEG